MDAEITTMSQKGQVVIPQKIRKSLKIKPGTRLLVYAKKDLIIMKPFELPRIDLPKADLDPISIFGEAVKSKNVKRASVQQA